MSTTNAFKLLKKRHLAALSEYELALEEAGLERDNALYAAEEDEAAIARAHDVHTATVEAAAAAYQATRLPVQPRRRRLLIEAVLVAVAAGAVGLTLGQLFG